MPTQDYTKWKLPEGAKARLGKGNINDIAYSPDGTCLAVAGSIGTWLYDMRTGEELTLLTGHSDTVSCVAYSPTGKTIATGSYDGTVCLWDTATRDHKITLPTHFTCWYGYNCITRLAQDIYSIGSDSDAVFLNKVTNLMYSPDGNTIVTCAGNFVQLWDAITGRHKVQIESLNQFGDPNLQSVTYTRDGSVLITQNTDRVIDFWDAAIGKHKGKFTEARYRYRDDEFDDGFYERPEEISGIKTIACSPDGQTIALGYIDGTVKLWNPEAHKHTTIRGSEVSLPKAILREHTSTIWSLAFDISGDILASGSSDGMICLWNSFTGERITTLTEHTTNIAELTYNSDGTVPLSTIVELTFSPNSPTLVSRNYGGVVSLWNIILNTYEQRSVLPSEIRATL